MVSIQCARVDSVAPLHHRRGERTHVSGQVGRRHQLPDPVGGGVGPARFTYEPVLRTSIKDLPARLAEVIARAESCRGLVLEQHTSTWPPMLPVSRRLGRHISVQPMWLVAMASSETPIQCCVLVVGKPRITFTCRKDVHVEVEEAGHSQGFIQSRDSDGSLVAHVEDRAEADLGAQPSDVGRGLRWVTPSGRPHVKCDQPRPAAWFTGVRR